MRPMVRLMVRIMFQPKVRFLVRVVTQSVAMLPSAKFSAVNARLALRAVAFIFGASVYATVAQNTPQVTTPLPTANATAVNVNQSLSANAAALAAANASAIVSAAAAAHAANSANPANSSHAPSVSADAPAGSLTELFNTFVAEQTPPIPQDDADLWQRIRRGFAMEPLASPLVQDQEQWYATRQDYIRRFVERGSKYMYHIVEEVERRKMPTEIVLLPIIESAFNPQAYSRAAASGMWQFIPSTGTHFGLKQDYLTDHRRDVLLSTDAALDYLQKLYGMFNSWELALAAYNCGEGCVGRAIAANQRKGLPTDFINLNLPNETRSYVPKLIAVKNIILSPATYGIELNSVLNQPYFIKVAAPEKIDVKLAARLAEMPEADFSALNPAFNKPVAANTNYFLVPTAQAEVFKTNLDLYRSLNGPMVSWQTVTAKRGESIDRIAKRYGMTGSYLRATNIGVKERKGKLTAPASFMVPMAKEAKIIDATLDKKEELRASAPLPGSLPSTLAPSAPAAALASISASTADAQTQAQAASEPPAVLSNASIPYSYQVQPGDTLFSVSKRFGLTVAALKQLNGMPENSLQSGQILKLLPNEKLIPNENLTTPVAVSAVAAVRTPPRASLIRVKTPPPVKNYTVKNGDSLFAIAQKFAVSIDELRRWNKLSAKAVIRPGAKLRVS